MKLFGQYLIDKGHVSQKQLLECLIEQSNLMQSIPKLCFDHKILEENDIFEILKSQATSKKDFVTLATDMGLWSQEKQDKLEAESKKSRPKIGQLLIEKGIIPNEKLAQILADYFVVCDQEKAAIAESIQIRISEQIRMTTTDFLALREIMALAESIGNLDLHFDFIEFIFKYESGHEKEACEKDRLALLQKYAAPAKAA